MNLTFCEFIKIRSHMVEQKKPLKQLWLEGLHPAYLTLFMYCPISVIRRVGPPSNTPFSRFHLWDKNACFSMV